MVMNASKFHFRFFSLQNKTVILTQQTQGLSHKILMMKRVIYSYSTTVNYLGNTDYKWVPLWSGISTQAPNEAAWKQNFFSSHCYNCTTGYTCILRNNWHKQEFKWSFCKGSDRRKIGSYDYSVNFFKIFKRQYSWAHMLRHSLRHKQLKCASYTEHHIQ